MENNGKYTVRIEVGFILEIAWSTNDEEVAIKEAEKYTKDMSKEVESYLNEYEDCHVCNYASRVLETYKE